MATGCPSGPKSTRAAAPEAAQRAAQQRFYLQPADNRVEIDRSCRQRVTPCLSAPNGSSCHYSLDRSSLTPSGSAWGSQSAAGLHHLSVYAIFMELLFHCLWLSCLQSQAVRMAQDSRVTDLLYPRVAGHTLLLQPPAVPGVNTQHL